MNKDNIKTLYYALVYSRIKYGISVYGQACDSKLKRIQTLQNRLLKVLSGKNYRFSTDMLHTEFEILKIKDIVKQEVITFVHNYFSNSLQNLLIVILKPLIAITIKNTRYNKFCCLSH